MLRGFPVVKLVLIVREDSKETIINKNVAIANNKKQVEQSQRHYSLELKQVKSQKLPQNFRFQLLHSAEKL